MYEHDDAYGGCCPEPLLSWRLQDGYPVDNAVCHCRHNILDNARLVIHNECHDAAADLTDDGHDFLLHGIVSKPEEMVELSDSRHVCFLHVNCGLHRYVHREHQHIFWAKEIQSGGGSCLPDIGDCHRGDRSLQIDRM